MPAMYPEELARLRADHPNLQYDFRGNVTGVSPAYTVSSIANGIRGIMDGYRQPDAWDFGPTRNDYLNSKDFVGPMPQQWWDPNGDLMRQGQDWLGGFMQGFDLQPRRVSRPSDPYAGQTPQAQQASDRGGQPPLALHADAGGILADAAENGWGVNAFTFRPSYDYRYAGYGLPYPYDDHDDGSGEYTPGI